MITYGFPHSVYLLGLLAKKCHGAKWVIYHGDMWTHSIDFSALPRWRRALDRKLERHLLSLADKVIVNTPQMLRALIESYPEYHQKFDVLELGYDPDEYSAGPARSIERTQRNIIYTGTLSSEHRIEPLCDALGTLARRNPALCPNLIVFGRLDPSIANELRSRGTQFSVSLPGYVGRSELVEAQRTAWRLLAYGMAGGLQIPSKLVEYAGAGRPVLLLTEHGSDDLSADWVIERQVGKVVENSAVAILEYFEREATAADVDPDDCLGAGAHGIQTWTQMEERFNAMIAPLVGRNQQ